MGGGDGGQWAAGPMSIPAPVTINKGMIYCDNIPGPTVECRGSPGAAFPNARIKLTVYSRFSDARDWSDFVVKTAHAFPGSTDFCNADGTGAFGLAPGDCSVTATAGEKVGVCVAGAGSSCAGPEHIVVVPVEGGTVSGASAVTKGMSVTPSGEVLSVRRWPKPSESRIKGILSILWISSAHAEEPAVPVLTVPSPTAALCEDRPPVELPSTDQGADSTFISVKKKILDNPFTEFFKFPGDPEKVVTIFSHQLTNRDYFSIAAGNRLYLIHADSLTMLKQFFFPFPIKGLSKTVDFASLDVTLKNVTDGGPSLYRVVEFMDNESVNHRAECAQTTEANSFTTPLGFDSATGKYFPPIAGAIVPISFKINAGVGEFEGRHRIYYRQDAFGSNPAWEGSIYEQNSILKDIKFLAVRPAEADRQTSTRVIFAVLDPDQNRILFFNRKLNGGDQTVTPFSLEGYTTAPVLMGYHSVLAYSDENPRLVILDSGDQGATAVVFPFTISNSGEVNLLTRHAQRTSLGPVVVNSLERVDIRGGLTPQWITYDQLTGNVVRFTVNPEEEDAVVPAIVDLPVPAVIPVIENPPVIIR